MDGGVTRYCVAPRKPGAPGTRLAHHGARRRFSFARPTACAEDNDPAVIGLYRKGLALRNRKPMPPQGTPVRHRWRRPHAQRIDSRRWRSDCHGLYSLLEHLILPGIALRLANQQLANYLRYPYIEHRAQPVQPGADRSGPANQRQAGTGRFRRQHASLQLDSLWTRAVHALADVQLDKPKTELLFDRSGQLNLAQLFKLPPSSQPRPIPTPNRSRCVSTTSSWPAAGHISKTCARRAHQFLYDKLDFQA